MTRARYYVALGIAWVGVMLTKFASWLADIEAEG